MNCFRFDAFAAKVALHGFLDSYATNCLRCLSFSLHLHVRSHA